MPYSWESLPLKVSRDKIKANPSQVGKAAFELLSNPIPKQEVQETVDAMTPRYYKELMDTINNTLRKYEKTYYIVVLRKKETLGGNVTNVLRQWYVDRQTKPTAHFLRNEFPNHDHDVWEISPSTKEASFMWTLPTKTDCKSILKNRHFYDPSLVKTIQDFNAGKLA